MRLPGATHLPHRFSAGGPYPAGRTALHAAVINEHADVIDALLAAGADPNRWDRAGYSPFHIAVLTDRLDVARQLLERGADVNWPVSGFRPKPLLQEAVSAGSAKSVKFLSDAGADVNAESHGKTALHKASGTGNSDMVRLLLSLGADPNAGSHDWKPLASAISRTDEAMLVALLDAGADFNARIGWGDTSLHLALRREEETSVALLLLDRGADVTIEDDRGVTPLAAVDLPPEVGRNGLRNLLANRLKLGPRAALGVNVNNISSARAAALGQPTLRGVEVADTIQGSAARSAGIRRGDVIIAFNGQPVRTGGELTLRISSSEPGERVSLNLLRDGKRLPIELELGSR